MHKQKQLKELDKELLLLDVGQEIRTTTETVILAELAKVRAKEEAGVGQQAGCHTSGWRFVALFMRTYYCEY